MITENQLKKGTIKESKYQIYLQKIFMIYLIIIKMIFADLYFAK